MMEKTVSADCLGNKTSTKCLVWNGKAYPELNISPGDSLEYVLDRIVSALNSKPTQPAGTVNSDFSYLQDFGVTECAAQIVRPEIDAYDTLVQNKNKLVLDGTELIDRLPDGFSVSTTRVVVMDNKGTVLGSARSPKVMIDTRVVDYPVVVDYTMFINSSCGTIVLSYSNSVDSGPQVKKLKLKVNDAVAPKSVSTVEDAIKTLSREVQAIKNRM